MKVVKYFSVTAILISALALVACGGGGGGSSSDSPASGASSPTPTSVTTTCPNGSSQTADTLAHANALCPAPLLVSTSPADKDTSVSPDAFTGVTVTTDSVIDIATATVAMKAGGATTVLGTVSTVAGDSKRFKFIPTNKLYFAQPYTFTATVKDTLGRPITVNITFTTTAVSCTAPKVPDATGTACVNPVIGLARWTTGSFYILIQGNGAEPVRLPNKSQRFLGIAAEQNCKMLKTPESNGTYLAQCQVATSDPSTNGKIYNFYVDLNTQSLGIYDYDGPFPTAPVWQEVVHSSWMDTQEWSDGVTQHTGWYTAFNKNTSETIFVPNDDFSSIWLLNKTTGTSTLIQKCIYNTSDSSKPACGNILWLLPMNN